MTVSPPFPRRAARPKVRLNKKQHAALLAWIAHTNKTRPHKHDT
jgi:hypothetical protein